MAKKIKPPELTIYKIRQRPGAVESSASEKDILRKIEKGKLTGDEQISSAPKNKWEKLSAHATFYDAFLKRLYKDDYAAPVEDKEATRQKAKRGTFMDRATRQQERGELPPDDENHADPAESADGKTEQLAGQPGKGVIHQSSIDDLFSQVSIKNSLIEGPGTDIIAVELSEPKPDERLQEPLDGISSDPIPEPEEPVKRTNRKRLYMYGGLALLLLLLFQMGKSDPVADKSTSAKKELSPELKELIGTPSNKGVRMRALVEEGDHLYENDTPIFYGGARELFNEALALDQANAFVRGRYAEASARLLLEGAGSPALSEDIRAAIREGRKSDPQFSQFFRVEAMLALHEKNYEEAKRALSFASEADPANSDNTLIRGEILLRSGDLKGAEAAFQAVIQAEPANVRSHYFLQLTALSRSDMVTAQKEAFKTLTLNPIHAASFFTLGQIASEENRLKEAKQLYQTCVALARFAPKKEVARVYYRLGLLQDLSGEKEPAKKSFLLAYYYDPENRGELGEKLKGLDLSPKLLSELALANEYGPVYFTEQAENLITQKKFNESLVFLRAASLLQPESGLPQVRIGEVAEKLVESFNDFQTVISYYQRAIEREPTLTRAYIKLGLLETEQYNFDRAYKLLKQAQALSPDDAESSVALGKYFFKAKDYTSAIEQLSKAFKKNPYDSEILYYAGLLALLGRKDGQRDAINFFYRSYLLNPNNYDSLVEWAKLKVLRFEKNFALKFVRNLIEQDNHNANWYWVMGEIYAANKEFRRAITFYHQSLDVDNHLSRVRMALGKSLEAVGEIDAAIAEYRVASMIDRRNSEGFYRAAELLLQLKNYKDAEEALKYLVSITPNYPGSHRTLAQIYQMRDQRDKAVAEMSREVQNNPGNVQFRLEYAQLLMSFSKTEQAILELTDVTNLPSLAKPEAAYEKVRAFLLLSRCYRDLSRFDSAEGTIRLALEIDNDDPELHRELGYVYHGLQREKEAVAAFQFYLNRNPAAADAATIKSIIQNSVIDE